MEIRVDIRLIPPEGDSIGNIIFEGFRPQGIRISFRINCQGFRSELLILIPLEEIVRLIKSLIIGRHKEPIPPESCGTPRLPATENAAGRSLGNLAKRDGPADVGPEEKNVAVVSAKHLCCRK